MEKAELIHDYKLKKGHEMKDSEERKLEHQEKEWLTDKIKNFNLKKLRGFIEVDYKKYEETKFAVMIHKCVHERLAQLVKQDRLYCFDLLKDLFKSEGDYELTEEEYLGLLNGEEVKIHKDAQNLFRVETKLNEKPSSGKPYNELVLIGRHGGNQLMKQFYVKKEVCVPQFQHKEDPSSYLSVFDALDAENLRLQTFQNGGEM